MRRKRGLLDLSVEAFYAGATSPEGLITELPSGKSVLVKHFNLPNGGSIATHEDCTCQRQLSRKLASTTQFLESVLDNVPVCVAAKSIEDGRYIFANRAFTSLASAPTKSSGPKPPPASPRRTRPRCRRRKAITAANCSSSAVRKIASSPPTA